MVFVAVTQHLMQTCENCIKWPLAPARREGYCEPSVLGVKLFTTGHSEEAVLLTFLDLSNYKGDCRQAAQPIPNSYSN